MTLIEARDEATRRFLGRNEIVGVALRGPSGPLVMLMRRSCEQAQSEVKRWAGSHHIAVEFVVSGRISSKLGRGA
jgi:hypothetical protein